LILDPETVGVLEIPANPDSFAQDVAAPRIEGQANGLVQEQDLSGGQSARCRSETRWLAANATLKGPAAAQTNPITTANGSAGWGCFAGAGFSL